MEMDEVITQLQQWRNKRPEGDETELTAAKAAYQSDAYDRIFQKDGPESEGIDVEYTPRSPAERMYIADEDMIAKVK